MIKLRQVPTEQFFRVLAKIYSGEVPVMIQKHQDELGLQASCINCEHFATKEEICRKFKVRPPAKVIAMSCGTDWEDIDSIPF